MATAATSQTRMIGVNKAPDELHGEIVDVLHMHFSLYRLDHPGLIRRVSGANGVEIVIHDSHTVRHPDLAVVLLGKAPNARGRRMPDLVVEVVSPGKRERERDYVVKREDYRIFGILEFWIVDPFDRCVMIMSRPHAEAEWYVQAFGDEHAIVSPLLPGFSAEVGSLWAETEPEIITASSSHPGPGS